MRIKNKHDADDGKEPRQGTCALAIQSQHIFKTHGEHVRINVMELYKRIISRSEIYLFAIGMCKWSDNYKLRYVDPFF